MENLHCGIAILIKQGRELLVYTDGTVWLVSASPRSRGRYAGKLTPVGTRRYLVAPKTYEVHRLVAEAFLPDWAPNRTVRHKNGDRSDNRVCNLFLGSVI